MKRKLEVLVTCGPTREPLDPVRFLSNRSTGTLGIELAKAFAARGHRVVLAAGPIELPANLGPRVRVVRFETARDLQKITLKEFSKCDALCMTAAVADFRPLTIAASKIKRAGQSLAIKLVPNPDILAEVGRRKRSGQMLVGFAVESSKVEARAKEKLIKKNLDLIIAQRVGAGADPFGPVLLDTFWTERSNVTQKLRGISKRDLALKIVRRVEDHPIERKAGK